jgi:hypothetical protein
VTKRTILAFSVGFPLLALLVSHLFFLPMYDVNDDPTMDMMARGIGFTDEPSPFILFSNICYGQLLSSLYSGWAGVPWFRLLSLALQWFAGVALAFAVLRRGVSSVAVALLAAYFLVFDVTFYIHPSFTITPALASAGAVALWLSETLERERPHPGWAAAVALLLLWAGLVRRDSLLLVLLLGLPVVLVAAIRFPPPTNGGRRRLAARCGLAAGPLLLAALLVQGLYLYDRHVYRVTPGWGEFHESHEMISAYNDFQQAAYTSETREIFEEVGWSPVDFAMVRTWFFYDKERFSLEKMRAVLDAFPQRSSKGWRLDGADLELFRNDPYRNAMIATLIAVLLFVPWRDRRLAVAVVAICMLLAVCGYLLLVLHRFPPRVYQPMFACLAAFLLVLTDGGAGWRWPRRVSCWIGAAGLIVVAGMLPSVVATWDRAEFGRRLSDRLREGLIDMAPSADRLYVVWGASLPFELIPPFSSMDELREMKIFFLASGTRSRHNAARLEEFGIEDIHLAIYTREDVFVISNDTYNRVFVAYVAEHYGDRIEAVPVARYDEGDWHLFTVYRFRRVAHAG